MDEKFIINQVYAFVFSVAAGAAWIAVYDVLKMVRHLFACNRIITAFCDVLFWVIGAAFIIATALFLNEGFIRSYLFIGMFFGAILYVLTIGNILKRIGRVIYVKSAPIRCKVKSVWTKYSAQKAAKRLEKIEAKRVEKLKTKQARKLKAKRVGKHKSQRKKRGANKLVNKQITGGINSQKVV